MVTYINPSVERLPINMNPMQRIERCGRVCYKSEDKITEDSWIPMLRALRRSNHLSVFEHCRIIFDIPYAKYLELDMIDGVKPYLKHTAKGKFERCSTNLRVLFENEDETIVKYILDKYKVYSGLCKAVPTAFVEEEWEVVNPFQVDFIEQDELTPSELMVHGWLTVIVTTNRGISHEIVRHRKFSFSQESTRFCNYGGCVKICLTEDEIDLLPEGFFRTVKSCTDTYTALIMKGIKPENAREILPTCLKTEICITGTLEDWKHFLDLRLLETTGKAHPHIKQVAQMINDEIGW